MSAAPTSTPADTAPPWKRLSVRVVWVDLARSALSLVPGLIAIVVIGAEPSLAVLWPVALVAVVGVFTALVDITRWTFTRYRVTDTEISRTTGILVRRHRTVQRDRIRSVDTHAKLRHRLAGLRVVTVGAGQQTGAGEAAFVLDALTKDDARWLRQDLLGSGQPTAPPDLVDLEVADDRQDSTEVLATFRRWWVVYNLFGIWAYLIAAGLLWGLLWMAASFGIDVVALAAQALDWDSLGWLAITAVALVGGGLVGAIGMGVNFLTAYWGFELARVRSADRVDLRTRRGLFSTREVNRDEARIRGLSISEPLLWRWMGMADTTVITTGLSNWDMEQPTAILPRGPVSVARTVAHQVLGSTHALDAPLVRHPPAALRHRLWWATLIGTAATAVVAVPVATEAVPLWVLWIAVAVLPIALLGALIAYRSLGHAIVGDHLVVRSGLMTRTTSALRRDAVSTIAVRQSVLQRRLGLSTVTAMTAAGWGAYEAPDVAADSAVELASVAAPDLVTEFVVPAGGRG